MLKDYFPDKMPKGKVPEKKFFWGILFAVKPGYAKTLVKTPKPQNWLPTSIFKVNAAALQ